MEAEGRGKIWLDQASRIDRKSVWYRSVREWRPVAIWATYFTALLHPMSTMPIFSNPLCGRGSVVVLPIKPGYDLTLSSIRLVEAHKYQLNKEHTIVRMEERRGERVRRRSFLFTHR